MTNPTLRRRSGWLALIAVVSAVIAVIAGYQRTSSPAPSRTPEEGPEYLRFLEERSMLFQAGQVDEAISGEGAQWREDYGQPESGELVRTASVWLLYYPGSVITKPDESVIGTWADPQFWDAVRDVGIDLLHTNPVKTAGGIRGREFTPTIDAKRSAFGLPKAEALYGSLPEQLASPDSFASQLKRMLAARKQHRIHEGEMLAVPNVGNPAVCALVMRLPDSEALAITALNYGRNGTSVDVDLNAVPGVPAGSTAGQTALDIVADQDAGVVSDAGRLTIELDGLSGRTIVVQGQQQASCKQSNQFVEVVTCAMRAPLPRTRAMRKPSHAFLLTAIALAAAALVSAACEMPREREETPPSSETVRSLLMNNWTDSTAIHYARQLYAADSHLFGPYLAALHDAADWPTNQIDGATAFFRAEVLDEDGTDGGGTSEGRLTGPERPPPSASRVGR